MAIKNFTADFQLARNPSSRYTLRVLTSKGRDYIARTRTWTLVAPTPLDANNLLYLEPAVLLTREQAMRLIVDCHFDELWIEYSRADVSLVKSVEN